MRCTVLGSGTWGTALGQVLADNGNNVTIYGIDNNEVNDININHKKIFILKTFKNVDFFETHIRKLYLSTIYK